MFHIGYLSSAVAKFTKPQLRELLERSRKKNERLQITGLLLYRDGNFFQVLEGEEEEVLKLFQTVCLDPRHKDIFTLFQEPVQEREFGDWSMAFHDLDLEDFAGMPGYSDFLNTAWNNPDRSSGGSKAKKLLAGFRERLR